MLPERSHYFDAGVDQKIPFGCASTTAPDCSMLELGVDAYYKIARDLLDNGTFGQALVLSAFNYAQGISEGVEFSAKYHSGNFQAYGNLAVGQEKATNVVSNQYLFDNATPLADLGGLTELQYIDSHWIYTDHNQFVTGSAGVSYLWYGTRYSADMIYGSGLRTGDANTGSESPYTQFNVGASHDFAMPDGKPAHSALRRRQSIRHDLPDQKRQRHRRIRAAIWPAPRLFRRRVEENLNSGVEELTFGTTAHPRTRRFPMQSCLAARTGRRLFLSAPLLLIFMSFATGVAHGKASPFVSHVTVLPPHEGPSQQGSFAGRERGFYREPRTRRCLSPTEFGN